MRKYLRSIARYALSLMGVRHINKAMSAYWIKAFREIQAARYKQSRKNGMAYIKRVRKMVRAYRINQFMYRIASPFLRLLDAIKGMFYRLIQPA